MKHILVFLTLIAFWNDPAFSQGSVGDPPPPPVLQRIPDDKATSEGLEPSEKGSKTVGKSLGFFITGNSVKRLVREVNSNVVNKCHQEDPKISGIKSLVVYLMKKETEEKLKKAVSVHKKEELDCKDSALDCVFKGSVRTFSKLIHQRNFVPYLVEVKGWKKEDARLVSQYLLKVESELKSNP